MKKYRYDVALSFAGEDRRVVQEVADILSAFGLQIFYDDYFASDLLGENLFTYLRDIYKNKAKYAIIFISKNYKKKIWTMHEWKSIQEAILERKQAYVLPIMLEEVDLVGLSQSIGYIKSRDPKEIAYTIAKKINSKIDIDVMIEELRYNLPDYEITPMGANIHFKCDSEEYEADFPLKILSAIYEQGLLFEMFIEPAIVPN